MNLISSVGIPVRSNEVKVWNCRSVSIRLYNQISSAKADYNHRNLIITATGSPNISRSCALSPEFYKRI